MLFFFFFTFSSYLIAMARTSNTMFNRSGESGHLCLVSDVKENNFNFSPLSISWVLAYMAFIMLRYVPSNPTLLRVFIITVFWILSNFFSISIYIIIWFFILHIVYVMYHINWYADVEPILYLRNQSHLIMLYGLSKVLLVC